MNTYHHSIRVWIRSGEVIADKRLPSLDASIRRTDKLRRIIVNIYYELTSIFGCAIICCHQTDDVVSVFGAGGHPLYVIARDDWRVSRGRTDVQDRHRSRICFRIRNREITAGECLRSVYGSALRADKNRGLIVNINGEPAGILETAQVGCHQTYKIVSILGTGGDPLYVAVHDVRLVCRGGDNVKQGDVNRITVRVARRKVA